MILDPGVVYHCVILSCYGIFNDWREGGFINYEVYKTGLIVRPHSVRSTTQVQVATIESLNVLKRRGHLIFAESGSATQGWNRVTLLIEYARPLESLDQIPACLGKPSRSWLSDGQLRAEKLSFDKSIKNKHFFRKLITP